MGVKVRERKPGEWWIFIDHKGRRKAAKVGSREAADEKAIEIEKALVTGSLRLRPAGEVPTLRQYSEKWISWLEVVKKRKPSTIRDYQYMLDSFILPEFGAVPIDELRRDELKALCKRLLEKKYPCGTDGETGETIEKPYSETTVHHLVRVLAACLAMAKEDGLVTENVAALPGKFLNAPKPGEKADVLTEQEADHLLATTRQHFPDLYPLVFFLLRSGMRKGEVRGLQWGDIDMHSRFIAVRRAFSKKDLGTPKGGKARTVEMGDMLMAVLSDHKRREAARALSGGYPMPEWAFPSIKAKKIQTEEGVKKYKGPMEDGTVNGLFDKCLTKAGIRHIRVHDTRHCVASWHLDKGSSLEETKRLLGHSTIKLTSDTYGHKVRQSNPEMANRLDRKAKSATQPQPAAVLPVCDTVTS